MRGWNRLAPAISVVVAVALAACAVADPAPSPEVADPWDEPVPGAVAVTEWEDQGQPTSPFGPGEFSWGSPEELIAAMAQAFASSGIAEATGRVVERRDSGTVVGWVRMRLPEVDGSVLAADMRVEMRNDGGSWVAVRTGVREHCARDLSGGECR